MSYLVTADGNALSSFQAEGMAISNAVVTLEAGKAGKFTFSMTPDHPYYNGLVYRQTLIDVIQNGEIIFEGVPVTEKIGFNNVKTVECEGELSFLNDTIQRQAVYTGKTITQLLTAYLSVHNDQADATKQFAIGNITVTAPANLSRITDYTTTMTSVTNDLVKELGGYLMVRHSGGVRYLDYLAAATRISKQVVQIGKNLMDLVQNSATADICTVVVPLGAKTGSSIIDGLEERLTIASVNSGNDYLIGTAAAIYGYIWKVVNFEDVTSAADLKTAGQNYLTDAQWANLTITATAVDLGLTIEAVDQFRILDSVRVVSAPHGLDRYFLLTKLQIDLNKPGNTRVTLGSTTTPTLAKKTASTAQRVTQQSTQLQVEAAGTARDIAAEEVNGLDSSLDAEDVFNRLTDNGTIQGIFRDSVTGDLYINGEWIQAATIRADSIQTTQGVDWVDVIADLLSNASDSHPVAIGDWEAYGSGNQFTLVKTASPKVFVRFIPATLEVRKAADNVPVNAYIIFYDGTKWYALYKLAGDAAYISEINNPN